MSVDRHDTYDYSFSDGRLTIVLKEDLCDGAYDDAYEVISVFLTEGLQSILIDKNGQVRPTCLIEARDFGRKLGELLSVYRVKMAVVTEPNDHYEAAVGSFAAQLGARVLIANGADEATLWLDGIIN